MSSQPNKMPAVEASMSDLRTQITALEDITVQLMDRLNVVSAAPTAKTTMTATPPTGPCVLSSDINACADRVAQIRNQILTQIDRLEV